MSKRKTETVSGYIIDTSPAKSGYVRFKVQTGEGKFKKAICFDQSQSEKIKQHAVSGESVVLRSVKLNDKLDDQPSFAELIFDERSSIEKPAKGSIKFLKEDHVDNLLPITNIIDEVDIETRVNVRGAVLYDLENVVKRGSAEMLECKIKDATGSIAITLWGEYIKILKTNRGKSFVFKEIYVKDFKGKRLATTTGTVMIPTEPTEQESHILKHEKDDTVLNENANIEGVVEYTKHFSIYYLCKYCGKKLTDIMTAKKAKCNSCSTVQLVTGCTINRSVQISVNQSKITLFNEIICTLVTNTDSEEEISDRLLGSTVQVSYNKYTNIASSLRVMDMNTDTDNEAEDKDSTD